MKLSVPARELVSLIRRHNLSYDALNATCRAARRHLSLKPPSRRRVSVPKVIPDSDFKKFYDTIAREGDLKHEIMLKLLFYSGVRVSELCSITHGDVDLPNSKIYISRGKGDKDRYILFPDSFRSLLRAYIQSITSQHISSHDHSNRPLFVSRHNRAYSTRRIAQIIDEYAEQANIPHNLHPHLFRHQALTWLTKQGLSDAQIQLISGHASKKSLEVYQHVALSDVKSDYEEAMKKVDI